MFIISSHLVIYTSILNSKAKLSKAMKPHYKTEQPYNSSL